MEQDQDFKHLLLLIPADRRMMLSDKELLDHILRLAHVPRNRKAPMYFEDIILNILPADPYIIVDSGFTTRVVPKLADKYDKSEDTVRQCMYFALHDAAAAELRAVANHSQMYGKRLEYMFWSTGHCGVVSFLNRVIELMTRYHMMIEQLKANGDPQTGNPYCEHTVMSAVTAGIGSVVADIRMKLINMYPDDIEQIDKALFAPGISYKLNMTMSCDTCNVDEHKMTIVVPVSDPAHNTKIYIMPDGSTYATLEHVGGNKE